MNTNCSPSIHSFDFSRFSLCVRRQVWLILAIVFIIYSCAPAEQESHEIIAFTGATLIDGNGSDPVEHAVLLIRDGRVWKVGTTDEIGIPENAEVREITGKFIAPGIINTHGHVGETKGIEGGHYSRQNVIDNLAIYARYGITTVVSLGGDKPVAESLRQANDSLARDRARLYIAGDVISGETPSEAIAMVDSNARMGVDFMKIRVDDNLGMSTKMSEAVYRAVIGHAHELGFRIATHMYYLEDARKLVDAGTDMLAHSIRDLPIDASFMNTLADRRIPYCPTLTRELSTFVYGDTAEFFSDSFFLREYDSIMIKPLLDPRRQAKVRTSQSAITYKKQLAVAMANLKAVADRGVPVVFGTDSGVRTRFMGYFEHLEMQMMVEAGLSPMQVIVSASKNAAERMELKGLGTLAPGHWADFIILNANPLEDINNMRQISEVFVGGREIER